MQQAEEDTRTFQDIFVARQPVFDRHNAVWGYELLYRSNIDDTVADFSDQDLASMLVSTCGFLQVGESISFTQRVMINFTEKLILDLAPRALPPAATVIEVLEDVLPAASVQEALLQLKQEGYLIAIDDYIGESGRTDLLKIADVVKVDVLGRSEAEIADILESLNGIRSIRVAEKVDNREMHTFCGRMGFDLFQGYFYAQPENIQGRKLSSSVTSKLRLLQKIHEAGDDIREIVEHLKLDPSIGYRLLRYINSPAFGFSTEIDSIKRASDMLGIRRLVYWLQLVLMSDVIPGKKTQELYRLSLIRAMSMEVLCSCCKLEVDSESCFTFGLLSLLDAMFDTSMESILEQLPLGDSLKKGYVDGDSMLNRLLSMLQCIEQNRMDELARKCCAARLDVSIVLNAYIKSNMWVDKALRVIGST